MKQGRAGDCDLSTRHPGTCGRDRDRGQETGGKAGLHIHVLAVIRGAWRSGQAAQ
jgi:hypothetical protein